MPPSISAFCNSEQGVSPVVSTILLVAVTIILGSVITVFAFTYLDGVQSPAPTADFEGRFTDAGDIEITHIAGDTVPADQLLIRSTDLTGTTTIGRWSTFSGETDVSAGSSISASGFDGDETVRVIWQPASQDRSHVLREFVRV